MARLVARTSEATATEEAFARATEQRERRRHQGGTEDQAGPGFRQPSSQHAVPQPEGRSVSPSQGGPEFGVPAAGHIGQAQDAGDDLSGHQAVVIVQLSVDLRAHDMFVRYASDIAAVPANPAMTLRTGQARPTVAAPRFPEPIVPYQAQSGPPYAAEVNVR